MATNVIYQTSATSTGGGRDSQVRVDDGSFTAGLGVPTEMGGPGGDALNPEKLFAMGYAACFMGALRFYAGSQKIKVPADTSVQVGVGIGPRDEGGFGLAVDITVDLPGMDRAEAEALIANAHQVCPYSNATRGALEITPKLA